MPDVYANRFWAFISDPKEELRLKLFLENARAYPVAVLLLTTGLVLKDSTPLSGWFICATGSTFAAGCLLQSFVLCLRAFHTFIGIPYVEKNSAIGALRAVALLVPLVLIPWSGWHLINYLVEAAGRLPH